MHLVTKDGMKYLPTRSNEAETFDVSCKTYPLPGQSRIQSTPELGTLPKNGKISGRSNR